MIGRRYSWPFEMIHVARYTSGWKWVENHVVEPTESGLEGSHSGSQAKNRIEEESVEEHLRMRLIKSQGVA